MKIIDIPQSGSVGAVTSSRNRSGQYRRQRAIPTQPRTAYQLTARARLTAISAAWRGLSDASRLSWAAFASSFTVVNSLGLAINLTGSQCYVKVNAARIAAGGSSSDTPPALPSFDACAITGFTCAAGTPALSVAGTAPASGTDYMFYFSPQVSPGVSYNSNYRLCATIANGETMPYDALSDYTTRLGTLVAAKKIFLKVVQTQDGMQDSGTLFTATVGA